MLKALSGFIPVSELSVERVHKIEDLFAVGDELVARVIEVQPKEWHLKLSVKQVTEENIRSEYEPYLKEQEEVTTTLGDLFGSVLKDSKKKINRGDG